MDKDAIELAIEAMDEIFLTMCHTTVFDKDGAYDCQQGRITADQYQKIRQALRQRQKDNWLPEKLPCDVRVGAVTFRKGVKTKLAIKSIIRHQEYIPPPPQTTEVDDE